MADPVTPTTPLSGVVGNILSRAKVVLSPFPFGLSDDDNLRITVVNSVANVTLEVHYRLLAKDGSVKPGRLPVATTSARVASTTDFHMAGGFVTNISVFATAGAPLIGQTFVIVQIIRGIGGAAIVLGTMLQGYVTTTQGLGWPGSAVVSSTEGEPVIRYIQGTTVASGVDVVETVPTGARWELLAFNVHASFASTAIAITPQLRIENGGNVFAASVSPQLAANSYSSPSDFSWNPGLSPAVVTSVSLYTYSFPSGVKLISGTTIRMPFLNINWSATPFYIVREWQEVG